MLATGSAGSHERAKRAPAKSKETNHVLFTKRLLKTTENLAE
jgi:hypothetical protein